MRELTIHQKCAAQHFGLWLAEPDWFSQSVQAVRSGVLQPKAQDDEADTRNYENMFAIEDGIAHIGIVGMMIKGVSKYGGTSSVNVRRRVRESAADPGVKAILLHIDSPGGTTAGTAALADDVKAANLSKPVHAHIEDLGASAAYWIASQASHITAERSSMIGSIGTIAYIVDTSGEFEQKGWKAHVISTGKYKGTGADGIEVNKDDLAYIQDRVDTINEHFLADVAAGRGMTIEQVRDLADGRVHDADRAVAMGLIDGVQSLDDAVSEILTEIDSQERQAAQSRFAVGQVKHRSN